MTSAILTTIRAGQRFLVASHQSPDGDAIASILALSLFLREQGKEVVSFNLDGVPDELAFLPGADRVVRELPEGACFDAGFVLDSGELRRAGGFLKDCCRQLINIDHHPHSEPFGAINWVVEEACATGALVYRLIRDGGFSVSPAVAMCVYTAILSDTGSFRYSNANPEAFEIASTLVGMGISPWMVAGQLYENRPARQLRLLSRVLDTLTVSPCGRFGSVSVTLDMFSTTGSGPEDTDGLINYPRSIRGVEVALLFRQTESQQFKVSFRSKGQVNVGALAREFGGGGHHNAAGVVVDGAFAEVRATVLARLNDLLPLNS